MRSDAIFDMNGLPYPEFDGFFADLGASALAGSFEPHLVFETSRGCWWGAKHHCTFCGLNGDTMAFRAKEPERAFEEIKHLSERYHVEEARLRRQHPRHALSSTRCFRGWRLNGYELEIFYEVKANLRHAQLEKMRNAGVNQIQPGIESFSDQVLRLMDKGCTGFQNIQLLRWCEELDIEVAWNFLAGFPGESQPNTRRWQRWSRCSRIWRRPAPARWSASTGSARSTTNRSKYGFRRVRPGARLLSTSFRSAGGAEPDRLLLRLRLRERP